MKSYIAALVLGIGGIAILLSLGFWQVQRLEWKQGVLAEIDARIADAPQPLPAAPDAANHRYLAVEAAGDVSKEYRRILMSLKGRGPGYRIISALETTEGRRILVDRGFQPVYSAAIPPELKDVTIRGNLHWPDEVDNWTPEPDRAEGIWFARDIPALAKELKTEEVLLVARDISGGLDVTDPLPVDSSTIPNDHLQYAVTWFGLALVWLGMTLFLLWRIRQRTA